MTVPFEIQPTEVARLTDQALVAVVNKLLELEAQRSGVPSSALNLSWKQHTPDGGIDASADVGTVEAEWIPSGESIWQYKSGSFTPGQVAGELTNHPLVLAALERGARYVLALGRECTEPIRQDFEARLEDALAARGFPGRGLVRTGEDIARWASTHVAMAPHYFGHSLGDLMTYEQWVAAERDRPEFHPTAQQQDYLRQIQSDFTGEHHGNTISRIEGPSGVGKTRLAFQAASLDSIKPLVLFATAPQDLPDGFFGWARSHGRITAVLIVDECEPDQVARLSQHVLTCDGRLKLLTIGDGPRVIGVPPGRYYLETVQQTELEPIVAAAAPRLGLETRALVARLASGYVRAAVQIARNYASNPSLIPAAMAQTPGVREFLDGLLGSPDPDTRNALSGAALFTSLAVDDAREDEFNQTAALVGLTPAVMRDRLAAAGGMRVVQKRGLSVYITPEILAIRLAGEMWGQRPARDFLGFYFNLPSEDSRERFLKRLASLGDDERTREVVRGMLSSPELFGERTDLYVPTRSALARYLAEADPVGGLAMLERLLGSATVEELWRLNGGRRDVVATLEKLVWLPETFEGSARLLLALAEAENERYANNATGVWHQLFRPLLSGTAKPGIERMALLERILFEEGHSARRRELALEALLHVFETHVSRAVVMSSLGGRPLPPEWRPTPREARGMVRTAFELIRRLVRDSEDLLSTVARRGFLDSARSIVWTGLIQEVTELLRELAAASDIETPAEVARAIGAIIAYDADKLPSGAVERLMAIQQQCLDRSFATRLRRWLGRPSPEDYHEEVAEAEATVTRARDLADYAWAHREELEGNLEWLLSEAAQRCWHFFVRLGELDEQQVLTVRLEARVATPPTMAWAAMLDGHRTAGRQVWVEERLAALSLDPATAPAVLDALWRAAPTPEAARLIGEMVTRGTVPPGLVGQLVYGNWIGRLPAEDAKRLIGELLLRRSPEAYRAALGLLGMRLGFAKDEPPLFEAQIWPILEKTAGLSDNTMDSHYWEVLGKPMLTVDPARLATAALKMLDTDEYLADTDPRVKLLVAAAELDPSGVWKEVGSNLLGDWRRRFRLVHALKSQFVETLPLAVIEAWLPEHGEEGAVGIMEMTAVGPTLSPVQRFLLVTYPESEKVKQALLRSMHTGSFWGPQYRWLEERLGWIRQWAEDPSPVISRWARGLIPLMEEDIARTRAREEDEDLGLES